MNLEKTLYQLLVSYGPLTRGELVVLTNIPRSTIYDALVKLMLAKKITRFSCDKGNGNNKHGRHNVYFSVL